VPFDAASEFGQARAPVRCTINGVEYHSRLAVYGGRTYLGLRKEVRDAAGVVVGDLVEVDMELDEGVREVDVPAPLHAALAEDDRARETYESLSFTNRKEYARWIAGAKREETRERRLRKAVDMLREGVRHP
jgi:hypothetical protein